MRPHISINVKNVPSSVSFYEKVFGTKPQKQTGTYAKFDLKAPALNFTMQSNERGETSKVNHFGIEVESADAVLKWENELTQRGILSAPEMGTNCCFAKQDKVWFQDPDGNSWEIFYVIEQLPVSAEAQVCPPTATGKKCCQ